MSLSATPIGEAPIAAQPPGSGPKRPHGGRPPSNRRIVAKSDDVAQPEAR